MLYLTFNFKNPGITQDCHIQRLREKSDMFCITYKFIMLLFNNLSKKDINGPLIYCQVWGLFFSTCTQHYPGPCACCGPCESLLLRGCSPSCHCIEVYICDGKKLSTWFETGHRCDLNYARGIVHGRCKWERLGKGACIKPNGTSHTNQNKW